MAAATRRWATPETVRDKVRRRWDDGTLLRTLAEDQPVAPIEVPLAGPRASEIGDRSVCHYGLLAGILLADMQCLSSH